MNKNINKFEMNNVQKLVSYLQTNTATHVSFKFSQ